MTEREEKLLTAESADLSPNASTLLKRYERPHEVETFAEPVIGLTIPFDSAADVLAGSSLSPGSRDLLLGLLQTGSTRVFPGGGIGIEYGSLLKTSVRPEYLRGHVEEVASHLRERRVDLLLVPGMSGYPVGAMYSYAAQLPAILLKKEKLGSVDGRRGYPEGSFVIPSYTGDGDVVMSADVEAVEAVVNTIVNRQILSQAGEDRVRISIRCAGADDIIDKATMARAITESAPLICQGAVTSAISRYRGKTADLRQIDSEVTVVAWVTPLIKRYNRPHEFLKNHFGITPFAGLEISSVHLDPCAIGVKGIGSFAFKVR